MKRTILSNYLLVMTLLVITASFFSLDYASARGGDSGGDAIVPDGLGSVKLDSGGNDAPVRAVTRDENDTTTGRNRRGRETDAARAGEDSVSIEVKPTTTKSGVPAIEVKPTTTKSGVPAIVETGAITSGSATSDRTPVNKVLASSSVALSQNSLVTDQQKTADQPSATNSLDGAQYVAVITASLGALTAIAGVIKTMVRAK